MKCNRCGKDNAYIIARSTLQGAEEEPVVVETTLCSDCRSKAAVENSQAERRRNGRSTT